MPSGAFAVSRLVNPAGATPELTEEQVWKGLELKERSPQLFVPVLKACEVLTEEDNKLTRKVTGIFGPPGTPESSIVEEVESHKPAVVYFESGNGGMRVTNVLSYGLDGELILTYSWVNGVPGFPDINAVPRSEVNARTGVAVQSTIDAIRKMVVEGKL
ncbi:hypothetical protein MNV49_006623 [Pseudohyphozyma bogoriensis]|nr:hypothetical protein MNV49_006623 [Pseudohyphozyma bogoriensis]